MRLAHQIAAAIFLLLGAFMVERALVYQVFVEKIGTGPGFMPMLTGGGIVLLALLLLLDSTRHQPRQLPAGFVPDRTGWYRLGGVVGTLTAAIGAMNFLGFRLTMFLFVALVMSLLGRHGLWLTLAVALGVSLGVHWAFENKLAVPLPVGILGF